MKNNTLELENRFKPINISINYTDKFEKRFSASKDYSCPKCFETVYGGRKKPSQLEIHTKKKKILRNIKSLTNVFKLKKENTAIKDRIIRDIKVLFEH